MRRRRVERLIVRAEVALAEGDTDEVRDALAEMRCLDPALPQIAALEEKLAEAATQPAGATAIAVPSIELGDPESAIGIADSITAIAGRETAFGDPDAIDIEPFVPAFADSLPVVQQPAGDRRGYALLIAAASLMMAAAGAGTYWFYRSPQPDDAAATQSAAPAVVSSPAANIADRPAAPGSAPVLGDSADIQVETVEAAMVESLPERQPDAPPAAPEPPKSEGHEATSDAPAQRPLPAATSGISVPLAESTAAIEPAPAVAELRKDVPVEARNVAPAPVPDLTIVPPKLERTNPAPVPARLSEDAAVRGILDRYAEAYSRLDASAAQEIWPKVNRSALSHAFDGLASQQVSLDRCDVDVHGVTARAICAGSATWAPKIGNGGSRTEPRNWTFQLAKAGSDWQIVSARVQQPQNK